MPPLPPRPARLAAPLALLPGPVLNALAARAATQVLRQPLNDGDLADLEGQIVAIDLREPVLTLRMTVAGGRICPAGSGNAAVTVSATVEDLVLVAAQRSDPDTLFFRRRLQLSGDTALGVTVKNVLDSASLEGLPPGGTALLQRLADAVPASV